MPLPLLAAPAVLNLVAGTVARQALMTGARALITRKAGGALARSGAGRVLEGEFIAGSRAAGGLMRKNAGEVLEGQIVGGGLLQRLAKSKLVKNLATGAGAVLSSTRIGSGLKTLAKIGKGIGRATSLLGGLAGSIFGGNDNDGGDRITPVGGDEGRELAPTGGDATAFRGGLPTLRTPTVPGLPTFKTKKKTDDCCGQECCEITNRLLGVAIKYLAGIDATLKNQLDVQRASFTQEGQAAREASLEKEKITSGGGSGKIMKMVESTGKGMLSFLAKTVLMALALGLPVLVKKVTGIFKSIFEVVDKTIDKIKSFFGFEEEKPVTPTETPTGKISRGTRKGRGHKSTFDGTSRSAIDRVLVREGGYVNDPTDKGGETKFGISKRAYPNLDIKNLTQMEAAEIYKRDYWDAINADQLPENIREMAFDAAVNQGVPWTKKALEESNNDPQKFLALREERYNQIVAKDPSQAKFLKGWMNRLGEFSTPENTPSSTMVAAASDTAVSTMIPANTPTAASTISSNALSASVPAETSATPPAVVVASNNPQPSSTSVNANGPGEPSSPYLDSMMIQWTNYFTPVRV